MSDGPTGASPGKVEVSEEVLAVLARDAALAVDGVGGVCATLRGRVRRTLGALPPGVEVAIAQGGGVAVDLHLEVGFGVDLRDLASRVTQAVRDRIAAMASVPFAEVVVHFDALCAGETPAQGGRARRSR
jgi:uncharacterized alkaline shock family protein YloU